MTFKHVLRVALATFLPLASLAQAPTPPNYSGATQSVLIPFVKAPDWNHLEALRVKASINGGPTGLFDVDTGSIGMIVGASMVPNIDPKAPEGSITYSSSGVSLHGKWTKATVTFTDAQGGDAVAILPVLAVTSRTCTGSGVNSARCTPSDDPHPYMLGVGFGRKEGGNPDRNAFLNLREMIAGTMHRGYVIDAKGITLGLTDKVVGTGFVWQKLEPNDVSKEANETSATIKDWKTAPGSFAVKGEQAGKGTVLMDTGLTNMMIADSHGPEKGEIAESTPITIELLNGQIRYTFVNGGLDNPQAPRKVNWVHPTHGTFVNTGLRAFAAYDYLYDADGGWLALRPVKR